MWLEVYGGAIILVVLEVSSVYGVKCYSCLASHNYEDCAKPDINQISLVKCDMAALKQTRNYAIGIDPSYNKLFEVDSIETEPGRIGMACLKMITKVGNKDYFLRGCQLAEQGNLDICNKVKEHNNGILRTIYCSKCSSEGCNSSTKFQANTMLALLCALIAKVLFNVTKFSF
uniref:Uncharacterized protein LOC114336302 n=1 Tax=Diabrotica virgifera virgifera TaxID=50390 RepID=A0A6P7GEB0_DIAVI